MKFLSKLVIKYLKKGAIRTILSVVGIAISISLMVALFETLISIRDSLMLDDIYLFGYQDFEMDDIDDSKLKSLRTSQYIDEVEKYKQDYSIAEFKIISPNRYRLINVNIRDVNQEYFDEVFANSLIEGRLPESENEAILPYSFKSLLPIFNSLGGSFESAIFNSEIFNSTVIENINSSGNNGLNQMIDNIKSKGLYDYIIDEGSKMDQSSFSGEIKEFSEIKIVGYYSTYSSSHSILDFDEKGARLDYFNGIILRYKEITDKTYSVSGLFREFIDVYNPITTLNAIPGFSNETYDSTRINNEIIEMKYMGINSNYSFYVYLGTFIMALILLAVIVFIYNIFNTNYIDKTRDLGLLKVVGMTNKQLYKLIVIEGSIYFLISLPIGYLLGKIISTLLNFYVNMVLNESIMELALTVLHTTRQWVLILVTAISYIMIVISQLMASKNVFNSKPIDAINGGIQKLEFKPNNKSFKLAKKIFGYEGFIALKNIVRNKKRYILITISIVLSIVLFVSISFLDFIFGISKAQMNVDPNYKYGVIVSTDAYETVNIMRDMEKIDGIHATHSYSQTQSVVVTDDGLNFSFDNVDLFIVRDDILDQAYPEYINKNIALVFNKNKNIDVANNGIYIFEDKFYKQNSRNIKESNISDKIFLIQEYSKKIKGSLETAFNVFLIDNAIVIKSSSMQNIIMGDGKPLNLENFIDISKHVDNEFLKEDLKSILYKYPSSYERGYEIPLIRLIKAMSYGFLGLISIIGILNLYNSTYNNIATRKREMALFKAVGIENRKLKKIILLENMISVFAAALITLLIPILSSYIIWKSQETLLLEDFNYLMPIMYYLAAIIISIITIYLSTMLPFNRLKEESIIRKLKGE